MLALPAHAASTAATGLRCAVGSGHLGGYIAGVFLGFEFYIFFFFIVVARSVNSSWQYESLAFFCEREGGECNTDKNRSVIFS